MCLAFAEAVVESDLHVFIRDCDALETSHLECLIIARILNESDEALEDRRGRTEVDSAQVGTFDLG